MGGLAGSTCGVRVRWRRTTVQSSASQANHIHTRNLLMTMSHTTSQREVRREAQPEDVCVRMQPTTTSALQRSNKMPPQGGEISKAL